MARFDTIRGKLQTSEVIFCCKSFSTLQFVDSPFAAIKFCSASTSSRSLSCSRSRYSDVWLPNQIEASLSRGVESPLQALFFRFGFRNCDRQAMRRRWKRIWRLGHRAQTSTDVKRRITARNHKGCR